MHIDRFARTLFAHAGGGLLYVLGGEGLPPYQREPAGAGDGEDVEIVRFDRAIPNFLERALAYGARLSALLDRCGDALENLPLSLSLERGAGGLRPRGYACVYEVNGLPSIELPFAFPQIGPETLAKVRADEERCWRAADVVVVPAETIRACLVSLGCAAEKIVVIPNGAEPGAGASPPPPDAPSRYLLYFGALQPWQGIETLLRAFARLLDYQDLRLVLCAARRSPLERGHQRLAAKLGIRRSPGLAFRPGARGARTLACPRAAVGRAAARLRAQSAAGVRPAEDPGIDGRRRAGGRLGSAGGARDCQRRRRRAAGAARPAGRAGARRPPAHRPPAGTGRDGTCGAPHHRGAIHLGSLSRPTGRALSGAVGAEDRMLKETRAAAPARVTYADLDADQRRIVQEKRVALTLGVRPLLELLLPLARFDAAGDRSRARTRRWMMRGFVGTFVGGIALVMSGASLVVAPIPMGAALLALGAGLRYRRLRHLDLSDNLRVLVLPLLTVLAEETAPDSPVTLQLDLRPSNSPDKLLSSSGARAEGRYLIVERSYRDPWLTGQAELPRGVRLGWTIVDDVVEQKKTGRNARGKTKIKTKFKKRSAMTVTVALPAGSYAVADAAVVGGGDAESVSLKSREKRQTFTVTRVVKVASLAPPDAGQLLDLVAAAYRRVTPITEPART